jgi:hypothetical protein
MQSRWTYVATGVLAGVVGVLLTMVLAQNREPQAWAAPMQAQSTGESLQMYSGGSQNNINDVIWIVYKRAAAPAAGAKDSVLSKTEKITLCCYQVANGARNVKLVAVRDISFDIDLVEYGNDKPHVKEIVDELKKNEKK